MNLNKTVRLQKVIAEAGLASRRKAEEWITQGRVKVNGHVVTKLGTQVDPQTDKISVNNRPIQIQQEWVYYLFHKPKNVMVTASDPEGRPTIFDYLKKIPERVFPVGRLDFDSEGLMLLTNDGTLTNRWTHPSSKVPKQYNVKTKGIPTEEQLEKLKKGIHLEEGLASLSKIAITEKTEKNAWLEITLTEGKRRQIRRMLKAVDLLVLRLIRTGIGPLRLGKLKPGEYRKVRLTPTCISR